MNIYIYAKSNKDYGLSAEWVYWITGAKQLLTQI